MVTMKDTTLTSFLIHIGKKMSGKENQSNFNS